MGFYHRKLLDDSPSETPCADNPSPIPPCRGSKRPPLPSPEPKNCVVNPPPISITPPTRPEYPHPGDQNHIPHPGDQNHTYQTYFMTYLISGFLLCAIFLIILRKYYSKTNNRRSEGEGIPFGAQEDFLDEDHGMRLDNPIWYVNTVGLQQSVIDSIAIFKYKDGEGLIDGTDCSVCLNEFQEDESLRLLPKCSHAFHIDCIDTWLRSHKNCPMCRAPVVCDAVVDQVSVSMPDVNIDSGSREETQVGNSENYALGGNDVGEDGDSEMVNRDDNLGTLPTKDENTAESSKKGLPNSKSRDGDSEFGVPTNLAGTRQRVEEGVQPMRRSVSLDSSCATMIYGAVAGLRQGQHRGNLATELARIKNTRSKIVAKRRSGSSSKCKMTKSSAIGPFVSRGSISVKRSLSSGGKFLLCKDKKPVLDPSLVNLRSV